jgi:hypothetical protein
VNGVCHFELRELSMDEKSNACGFFWTLVFPRLRLMLLLLSLSTRARSLALTDLFHFGGHHDLCKGGGRVFNEVNP